MKKKKVLSLLATILITALVCFATFALLLRPQTLEVDAVSGATLTSDTVLKAIENALK